MSLSIITRLPGKVNVLALLSITIDRCDVIVVVAVKLTSSPSYTFHRRYPTDTDFGSGKSNIRPLRNPAAAKFKPDNMYYYAIRKQKIQPEEVSTRKSAKTHAGTVTRDLHL